MTFTDKRFAVFAKWLDDSAYYDSPFSFAEKVKELRMKPVTVKRAFDEINKSLESSPAGDHYNYDLEAQTCFFSSEDI